MQAIVSGLKPCIMNYTLISTNTGGVKIITENKYPYFNDFRGLLTARFCSPVPGDYIHVCVASNALFSD